VIDNERQHWVERVINGLGVPVAILLVLGFAAWRVVAWSRPYAERIADAHIELVGNANSRLVELAERIELNTAAISRNTDVVTNLLERLGGAEK